MNRKISVYTGSLPLRAGEVLAELPNSRFALVKVLPLQVSGAGDRRADAGFTAWASKTTSPDRVRLDRQA